MTFEHFMNRWPAWASDGSGSPTSGGGLVIRNPIGRASPSRRRERHEAVDPDGPVHRRLRAILHFLFDGERDGGIRENGLPQLPDPRIHQSNRTLLGYTITSAFRSGPAHLTRQQHHAHHPSYSLMI